jgi:hypothetical protein
MSISIHKSAVQNLDSANKWISQEAVMKTLNTTAALLTALTIALAATSASAQDLLWSKHFGGPYNEKGASCRTTTDSSVVLLGSTYSYGAGDWDIYLLKLNNIGDTVWTRTYGGDSTEYGYDMQVTPDRGFIVVGCTRSSGAGRKDVYLLKLDSLGLLEWSKTFGGSGDDEGLSVRRTFDGGYIVCGTTNSFGHGYTDVYLLKIDASGNLVWSKTYGGAGGDTGSAVRQAPDSGFIIIGTTGSFGTGYSSIYAVRADKNGDSVWATTYGGARADLGYTVENTSDGGFIFGGATVPTGAGYYDAYLVKTDPTGFVEWENSFGGDKEDMALSILELASGDFIVAGKTDSYNAYSKAYLFAVNPIGNMIWSRYYGGDKSDFGQAVIKDPSNDYYMLGYSFSYSTGGSDMYLLKIKGDQATDVNEPLPQELPDGFEIAQNYPNPFNYSTQIEYSIPVRSNVTLTVYNILGQMVSEFRADALPAGSYRYEWDGTSENGSPVASGVYLYRFQAGRFSETKKMVLLK